MKKTLFAMALSALALSTGSNAFAYEYGCQVNGLEEGPGSSNSIRTPAFYTLSSAWAGTFFVTNVSDYPLTVKLALTDANGAPYSPYSVGYPYQYLDFRTE